MSGNKLILDSDGLQIGATQLTASGGDISIGNNLTIGKNLTMNGYINGVALEFFDVRNVACDKEQTFFLNNANIWFTANAYVSPRPNFIGLANYDVGSTFYFNIFITNGPKAFNIESVQIDYTNTNVTMRWMGSTTPTATANAIDAYNFQIIKTNIATYTVFASKVQF